jgi:hypothetical protein
MATISANLNATEAELREIAGIFGVDTSGQEFEKILSALATAALREYTLAFSGSRSPGTLREMRELRVRLLFEHLPAEHPTDTEVAELMQLTPAAARTLIAGTRARFRTELADILRAAAVKALKESSRGGDKDTARVELPDSVAAYLRDLAAETRTPPLRKSDVISRTWEIKRSTAEELGKRLGFTIDDLEGFKRK